MNSASLSVCGRARNPEEEEERKRQGKGDVAVATDIGECVASDDSLRRWAGRSHFQNIPLIYILIQLVLSVFLSVCLSVWEREIQKKRKKERDRGEGMYLLRLTLASASLAMTRWGAGLDAAISRISHSDSSCTPCTVCCPPLPEPLRLAQSVAACGAASSGANPSLLVEPLSLPQSVTACALLQEGFPSFSQALGRNLMYTQAVSCVEHTCSGSPWPPWSRNYIRRNMAKRAKLVF